MDSAKAHEKDPAVSPLETRYRPKLYNVFQPAYQPDTLSDNVANSHRFKSLRTWGLQMYSPFYIPNIQPTKTPQAWLECLQSVDSRNEEWVSRICKSQSVDERADIYVTRFNSSADYKARYFPESSGLLSRTFDETSAVVGLARKVVHSQALMTSVVSYLTVAEMRATRLLQKHYRDSVFPYFFSRIKLEAKLGQPDAFQEMLASGQNFSGYFSFNEQYTEEEIDKIFTDPSGFAANQEKRKQEALNEKNAETGYDTSFSD